MSSIMRRRNGLMPSFVIAKAPVCRVGDSQPQPDRQVASLYKPSAPLSTGITLHISGLYRASGSVQSKMALVAICRRCKHQRVLYPANSIERFGEDCPAIELRER